MFQTFTWISPCFPFILSADDNKLSFKEFQEAPWIFGVSQEVEFLNQFAR